MIHVKCLEQSLVHSKSSMNISYYCFCCYYYYYGAEACSLEIQGIPTQSQTLTNLSPMKFTSPLSFARLLASWINVYKDLNCH